jgi:hypothetical protein
VFALASSRLFSLLEPGVKIQAIKNVSPSYTDGFQFAIPNKDAKRPPGNAQIFRSFLS